MVVPPAPAHRPADGELAVRRRDRAPRQRRHPRHGPPRRAEPDDGRPRHLPLRGLHRRRPPCCTASSCGWRCPTRPGDAPGLRALRPDAGRASTGARRGSSSARCSARPRRSPTFTPAARRRARPRAAAPRSRSPSTRPTSTACWSTPARVTSHGTASRPRRARLRRPRSPRPSRWSTAPTAGRLLLLGGPPFGEQIVMWWNFVGRSHDEIVAFPRAVAARGQHPLQGGGGRTPQFGVVPG